MPSIVEVEYRFPILTEATLKQYLLDTWGIRIPDVQVCSHHTTPWRAYADAYFARAPVSVWIGSRGFSGKTFNLANLGLTEAVTLGAEVGVLGGSGLQSNRVHEYMAKFWDSPGAPRKWIRGEPLKTRTYLHNGAEIIAHTASQKSVRGPHPSRLRCDEVDEMSVDVLKSATGQTMRKPGIVGEIETQTVLSSTHQYESGTMSQVLEWAQKKSWPVYEWCYEETMAPHGWLAPEEVERKRTDVPSEVWRREYDLQEPSAEGLAIARDSVERMFDSKLGDYDGGDGELLIIEQPHPLGLYAHGADWARKMDYSVFVVLRIDCNPWRIVAYRREHRKPWPVMVGDWEELLSMYSRGRKAAHDGHGVGDVVDSYLSMNAEAVQEQGIRRTSTLNNYVNAIEQGMITAPMIRSAFAEHKGAKVDDLYGKGHLPDTIQAGALAVRAAKASTSMIYAADTITVPEPSFRKEW